jgi:hypothetical protein
MNRVSTILLSHQLVDSSNRPLSVRALAANLDICGVCLSASWPRRLNKSGDSYFGVLFGPDGIIKSTFPSHLPRRSRVNSACPDSAGGAEPPSIVQSDSRVTLAARPGRGASFSPKIAWDIGDYATGVGMHLIHIYQAVRSYGEVVTATNGPGSTNVAIRVVVIPICHGLVLPLVISQ